MALLQLLVTMGLKYAFIGFDNAGIVAFFTQFDFKSIFNTNMSQDMNEALCDIGIIFYMVVGLLSYLLCSSKKKVSDEDKKQNKS